jgi:periplasmic protein TonB
VRRVAAAILLTLLVASAAWAIDPAAPPTGDVKIADFGDWTRAAGTAGPFTSDWACRNGVRKALVVIDCKVGLDGTLSACSVVTEDPPDYGFGDSAIKMAQRHAITSSPVVVDGKPIADHIVRLSLPFTLPPDNCARRRFLMMH